MKLIWVLGFIRHVQLYFDYQIRVSSISFILLCPWTGSLRHSTVQELICNNSFLLLMSHEITLKRVSWINLQRRIRTECVKLPLWTPRWHCKGIKHVSECCKQTFEHRESDSITKRKRSTLILERKELLLKHYVTWCIICRPPGTVNGCYWDFECSKVPGRNPGIWCKVTFGLTRWP